MHYAVADESLQDIHPLNAPKIRQLFEESAKSTVEESAKSTVEESAKSTVEESAKSTVEGSDQSAVESTIDVSATKQSSNNAPANGKKGIDEKNVTSEESPDSRRGEARAALDVIRETLLLGITTAESCNVRGI